jgi:hypothetical protein
MTLYEVRELEAFKIAHKIYRLLSDFSVLYDVWVVETKTFFALRNPKKASKLCECFAQFESTFDLLRCTLKAIGAKDIWEKYKNGRGRADSIWESMAR